MRFDAGMGGRGRAVHIMASDENCNGFLEKMIECGVEKYDWQLVVSTSDNDFAVAYNLSGSFISAEEKWQNKLARAKANELSDKIKAIQKILS